MPSEIKVPGIGPVDKKYVYIGAAGIAGYVGYMYWRNRQAATTTDTSSTTDTTSTDTGASDTGASYDPGYNYSAYADTYGSAPYYNSPSGYPIYNQPINQVTNNGEWAADAESKLTDNGVDALQASSAIGRFLAGLCLSEAQADIVRQAEGFSGAPPQGSFSVKICPPSGGSGSSGGSTGGTLPGPGDLHATAVGSTTCDLAWLRVPGAISYHLYDRRHSHAIGTSSGTHKHVHGMARHADYYFHVRAVGADGKEGQSSNVLHVRTK